MECSTCAQGSTIYCSYEEGNGIFTEEDRADGVEDAAEDVRLPQLHCACSYCRSPVVARVVRTHSFKALYYKFINPAETAQKAQTIFHNILSF